ncbi:SbcC/MukB-like Walker B domain-containing protein [uncultured Selenomonas sp.]|uniref:SbcC/MukB-like Walker B domain-containing protein n=1 Tax=uncultured Selenomonas sp. TaxID=159275 RepID=UPI0025F24AA2|nr:SbcC/MukB-like Walker B domain-containing protein [uncultured Selenomonas sp.]
MSAGRYALELGSQSDGRKADGLEIAVYDAYTGKARETQSLSGGESFLASLSLALGLADVVERYAGGIHLDTMFIDEGFGSLDSETLDMAIEALMKLQAGGRVVGIISHVEELAARIPDRLEITKGATGSTAQFVHGMLSE